MAQRHTAATPMTTTRNERSTCSTNGATSASITVQMFTAIANLHMDAVCTRAWNAFTFRTKVSHVINQTLREGHQSITKMPQSSRRLLDDTADQGKKARMGDQYSRLVHQEGNETPSVLGFYHYAPLQASGQLQRPIK